MIECFQEDNSHEYAQCTLVKDCQTHSLTQICWIPHEFAKTGQVVQIYENARAHRRATGDSLPKVQK